MKLTAGQAHAAHDAAKRLSTEKLPVKGKYWVGRIVKKLESEAALVEEARNDLVKKHGEEIPDKPGQIQVLNGKLADFMAEFSTVLAQEIEVDCPTVKLELLGDGEIETDLTPLHQFIEE